MFTDPTGLFETKAEAKEWAKENNIKTGLFRKHKINKNDDGIWSIDNKSDGISYSRDPSLSESSTMRSDGVIESVLVSANREINRNPKDLFDIKEGVALWGKSSSDFLASHKRTSVLFSLDMGDVFARSSPDKALDKFDYSFLSGLASRENEIKILGKLFGNSDPYINHKYKKYGIYQHIIGPEFILGMPADTMLRKSQINKFKKDHQFDSIQLIPLLK